MTKNINTFEYNTDILQKGHLIVFWFLIAVLISGTFNYSLFGFIIAVLIFACSLFYITGLIIKRIIFTNDVIKVFYPLSVFHNNRIIEFSQIKEIKYLRSGYRMRSQLSISLSENPNLTIYGGYNDFKELLKLLNKKGVKISSADLQTGWKMNYKEDVNPDDEEDFQIKL